MVRPGECIARAYRFEFMDGWGRPIPWGRGVTGASACANLFYDVTARDKWAIINFNTEKTEREKKRSRLNLLLFYPLKVAVPVTYPFQVFSIVCF